MRDIKFRAYVKEVEKVLPVCSLEFSWLNADEAIAVAGCGDLNCGTCIDFYKKDDVELMQYTGLKDINGREIYEGDIYEYKISINSFDNSYNLIEKQNDIVRREVIKYKNGAFMVGDYTLHDAMEGDDDPLIVGNVYENPELLAATQ